MEFLKKHLPADVLQLPTAPPNHSWVITNSIIEGKKRTKFYIEIKLITEGKTVLKIKEKWNRKTDTYIDFALSAAGATLLELDAYLGFSIIEWDKHNPALSLTKNDISQKTWVS